MYDFAACLNPYSYCKLQKKLKNRGLPFLIGSPCFLLYHDLRFSEMAAFREGNLGHRTGSAIAGEQIDLNYYIMI
jgi:hypothetical protein